MTTQLLSLKHFDSSRIAPSEYEPRSPKSTRILIKAYKTMTLPPRPACLSLTAYSSITACLDVSDRTRAFYIQFVSGAGSDLTQAEILHNGFRRRKKFKGQKPALLPSEGLGNLAPLDDLKKYSYRFFNQPNSKRNMTYSEFKAVVDEWIEYHESLSKGRHPTSSQVAAAMDIESKTVVVRDSDIIWLFRNPHHASYAFQGIVDGFLLSRLGLIPRGVRVTLSFKAAALSNVRRPTFLDATWEYLDYWDANGKTRPIAPAAGVVLGLEEVVASPPTFKDINGPVIRV